jgi:hypothetical protein
MGAHEICPDGGMLLPYRDGQLTPPISVLRHDLSLSNKAVTFATLPALQTQPLTDTVSNMFNLIKNAHAAPSLQEIS